MQRFSTEGVFREQYAKFWLFAIFNQFNLLSCDV